MVHTKNTKEKLVLYNLQMYIAFLFFDTNEIFIFVCWMWMEWKFKGDLDWVVVRWYYADFMSWPEMSFDKLLYDQIYQ